jgi:NAD(P)-dependent dehydrogenase (short-subunit alcohol dehydrogenase family)
MNRLKGRSAVVTGGSSGIGYGTAKELMEEGARVIITGRHQSSVHTAAMDLGAIGVVSDQSNFSDIDSLVAKAKNQFGKIDILVVNAGVYSIEPFESVSESSYDSSMDINLKGVFFTIQKFVPILNEGSSIILISSIGALVTPANAHSVYGATKAAVNSLARSISYELAPRKIRVNAVCPGPIETPIFTKVGLPAEALQQMAGAIQNKIPVKRYGQPSEIGKLVAFLCSDDASFITGAEYVIDGGLVSAPIMS